ncbi:MAG: hypothetical protein KIT31_33270, partial [Deltaproteobacteria bacterium]|nr:hypothetical protein [Deltaproteobacteria bacterium]
MRTPHAIPVVAAALALAACNFPASSGAADASVNAPEPDAIVVADAYIPDASASGCLQPNTLECAGPVLRRCEAVGSQPIDTTCAWGCSSNPQPHCAKLQPSGGAVTATDLDDPQNQLGNVAINAIVQGPINTSDGSITGVRQSGQGVKNGIDFTVRNGVGIFRMKSLTVDGDLGTLQVVGTNALAIVATGNVTFKTRMNLAGACTTTAAGPGGGTGGAAQTDGNGNGAGKGLHGSGIQNDASGGGGAGF